LLAGAGPHCRTDTDRRNLFEERLLTELIFRTMLSCEHTVRFLRARKEYERTGEAPARDEMRRIAQLERENAVVALPIYDQAPWLNLSERIDGKFPRCQEMIAEKVRWIDRFLRPKD
jgi:hypothetical protein